MAVSSETYKHIFTGDGSTVTFNFTFAVFAEADVKVTKYTIADGTTDVLTKDSDYTVSLTDDGASGGSITMIAPVESGSVVPPSSSYKIILTRGLDYTQDTDWVENDPFLADTVEDTVDKNCMLILQLKEEIDRAVLRDISASSQIIFPTAATSSGYLYYDGSDYSWGSTSTSVGAGSGINIDGSTVEVDINGTTDLAAPAVADEILLADKDDSNAIRKSDIGTILALYDDKTSTLTNKIYGEDILPDADDSRDLGSATKEFKDAYIDGVAYIDSIAMPTTTVTDILDQDDMSSDSASALATQQSIKAYVDAIDTTPGSSSVGQSELKTTTGEVSVGGHLEPQDSSDSNKTLPGGKYGFYPQVKAGGEDYLHFGGSKAKILDNAKISTSYGTIMHIYVYNNSQSQSKTVYTYAQQCYITASGHDHWIFLLVDKETKNVIGSYQAPDHPSANQGDATELDIPHPFGSYDPAKHEIVVVDNADLQAMITKKKQRRENGERGVSLLQIVNENYIIDDTKRPNYRPREIVKIDEEGDMEGETIRTMKTPDWAKIMISNDEIALKRRMVETLPNDILFKKMVMRR